MDSNDYKKNFEVQPIRNGFEDYRLSELEKMLRETIQYNTIC